MTRSLGLMGELDFAMGRLLSTRVSVGDCDRSAHSTVRRVDPPRIPV